MQPAVLLKWKPMNKKEQYANDLTVNDVAASDSISLPLSICLYFPFSGHSW